MIHRMGKLHKYYSGVAKMPVFSCSGKEHYNILKNFAWVNQKAKVYLIFHKVQLRCEECFIKCQQCFIFVTSKLNQVQLCMERSHLCKQQRL